MNINVFMYTFQEREEVVLNHSLQVKLCQILLYYPLVQIIDQFTITVSTLLIEDLKNILNLQL